MSDAGSFGSSLLVGFILIGCVFALYFLPAILAWNQRDFWSVTAINFFLGWTLVGWVVALAWALKGEQQTTVVLPTPALQSPPGVPTLCPHCGKYSEASSKFCSSCGQSFMRTAALSS